VDNFPGILGNLAPHEFSVIRHAMIETELGEGAVLFKQRDEPTGMFILKTGQLQVVTGKFAIASERNVVAEIYPDQSVGEFSVIDGLPRSATVIATQESTLLSLTAGAFKDIIANNESVARGVIGNLCDLIINRSGLEIKSEKAQLIYAKNLKPSLQNMKTLCAIIREMNKQSS